MPSMGSVGDAYDNAMASSPEVASVAAPEARAAGGHGRRPSAPDAATPEHPRVGSPRDG